MPLRSTKNRSFQAEEIFLFKQNRPKKTLEQERSSSLSVYPPPCLDIHPCNAGSSTNARNRFNSLSFSCSALLTTSIISWCSWCNFSSAACARNGRQTQKAQSMLHFCSVFGHQMLLQRGDRVRHGRLRRVLERLELALDGHQFAFLFLQWRLANNNTVWRSDAPPFFVWLRPTIRRSLPPLRVLWHWHGALFLAPLAIVVPAQPLLPLLVFTTSKIRSRKRRKGFSNILDDTDVR